MKKLSYLLSGLLALNILIGCSGKQQQPQNNIINIEKGTDQKTTINLKEMAQKVEYVPLETKKDLILDHVETFVTSNHIVAWSNRAGILLFDRKGKFIRKIGEKGQGPGEYAQIDGIWVDESTQTIYVKAFNHKELMKFNFNGDYTPFITMNRCSRFVYHNNLLFAHKYCLYIKKNSKDIRQLFTFDNTGKVIHKEHPADLSRKTYRDMYGTETVCFSVANNKLFYYISREDTIYNVTKNSCTPCYTLNIGKYSFSKDYKWDFKGYQNSYKTNKIRVENGYVTNSYVFLTLRQGIERRIAVYDSNKHQYYSKLVNNIDFLPITFMYPTYSNKMVDCLYANDLLELKEKEKLPQNLQAVIKKLKADDNPVLRIVTLK